MAAELNIRVSAKLTGLGVPIEFLKKFLHSQTPTKKALLNQDQAVADTEEALNIGDVSTIDMIVIYAKTNDVDIDTSYASATFSKELSMTEGEVQIFKPEGTVYIKNGTSAEQVTVEYFVIGR